MKVNACVKCGSLFIGRNECPVCHSNQFEILSLKSYDEGVEAFEAPRGKAEVKFPRLALKFKGLVERTKDNKDLERYLTRIGFHHYMNEIAEALQAGERKFTVGNRVSGFLEIEAL